MPLYNVLQHCHAMFPSCYVAISDNTLQFSSQSPTQLHQIQNVCHKINAPDTLPAHKCTTPLRNCVTFDYQSLPLPAAAVTNDKKWIVAPRHIFATKVPSLTKTPLLQANIFDFILDKETLYAVINAAFPSMKLTDFIKCSQ